MERRSVRITSLVAFALVLGTDVLYIVLINAQGPSPQPYIPRFVAAYLAVMAALVVIALVPRPEVTAIRVPLRAAAAGGLLALGVVAAFSIGTPLVLAGILVTFALTRTLREPRSRVARFSGLAAAALAIAVLLAGLEVTQRLVACPEKGDTAGGGSGFISGPYQYECVNGELRFHTG